MTAEVVLGDPTLRIEDGRLSLDGADKGEVRPGDKVMMEASGKLLVNGSAR